MAEQKPSPGEDVLTPQEMRAWLKDEVRDAAKAFELRVKDATELVTSYALGEISPERMNERLLAYDLRWGEALFGASADVSDLEILNRIDAARKEALDASTPGHTEKYFQSRGKSVRRPG